MRRESIEQNTSTTTEAAEPTAGYGPIMCRSPVGTSEVWIAFAPYPARASTYIAAVPPIAPPSLGANVEAPKTNPVARRPVRHSEQSAASAIMDQSSGIVGPAAKDDTTWSANSAGTLVDASHSHATEVSATTTRHPRSNAFLPHQRLIQPVRPMPVSTATANPGAAGPSS